MLGGAKDAGGVEWSVLILDPFTTKIMSNACRISEILDYGISLVEDIRKKREAMSSQAGIYFITPTDAAVQRMLEDWDTRPQYKAAHIFFSSKVSGAQLQSIRNKPLLTQRLRSLKEVNLELLTMDKRTFVTDHERALQSLFGENSDSSPVFRADISSIAARLATVFASLKELPSVRFRAAKPPEDASAGLEGRALVAQKIAVELNERLSIMSRNQQLPTAETCELIIFDRGFDPVAPVIHEWTYEAMAYDLLGLESDVFRYDVETQAGKMEKKEHLLAETDEMWVSLRHKHFAEATQEITRMLDDFRQKNKAAAYKGGNDGGGLDMRNMRNLVSSLPQYREQLSQLSVHVEIASKINRIIEEKNLTELGKLEQDLVFGDATSKEVITYLSANQNLLPEDKVRLLMCYCATHPEKMDATKQMQWQKLAKLTDMDMNTITNLEFLGVPVRKRGKATSSLTFGRKRKRAVRKRGAGEDEQQWALSRFTPLLQDVLEDMAANRLSTDEFPYVRPPSADPCETVSQLMPAPMGMHLQLVVVVRSNRSAMSWTKKAAQGRAQEEPGCEQRSWQLSLLKGPYTPGKRMIAFVVGGVTRSEMRVAHKLTARTGREVLLGGTTVDNPSVFLRRLQ
eukprot:jgi/Astpho2/7891/gw1.00118.18.1_t